WFDPPPASSRPDARAWLQRNAYAHLVPMIAGARDLAGRLEELDAAVLEALLERLGRRRVAIAFSGATHGQLAQLCARLGEPAAGDRSPTPRTPRPGRSSACRCKGAIPVANPAVRAYYAHMTRFLPRASLLVLALLAPGCGYNSLVNADEAVKAAWGNVENVYQRRADLI